MAINNNRAGQQDVHQSNNGAAIWFQIEGLGQPCAYHAHTHKKIVFTPSLFADIHGQILKHDWQ
jgi:hypothetical protein